MSLSDPVSDMLTRIRNAHMAGHDVVEVRHSGLKEEIARVLKKEGYVNDYVVEGGTQKVLRVYLKYAEGREAAIRGIKRESRPGLRRYAGRGETPLVLSGLGTAILSTSQGVMTAREANKRGVGGEVMCTVW